VATKDLVA